ncbi:MAG: hypothetical protein P1P88_18070 [Bacteroidales bacterium]|nr:hypothetical protein [Bacteroidales bacterium]
MAKINSVITTQDWGYDSLYPILQDAFRVLYLSYLNLYSEKSDNPYKKPDNAKNWHLEDAITDDLIKDEIDFDKKHDYSLIPQFKNIKKKSRIDISIHYRMSFGKYYTIEIECKQLKKSNLDYYISDGIQKFKTNKYAESLPLAGMMAYNILDEIENNIDLLKTKIEQKISVKETLKQFEIIENYPHTYFSKHERIHNSDIDLYTCAFDFKDAIEIKQ